MTKEAAVAQDTVAEDTQEISEIIAGERERMRRAVLELLPPVSRGSRRRLIQEGYTAAAADEIIINLIRQMLGEMDRDVIRKLLL